MADTTTPVTPPAQDLQINLEDAPKAEEITIPENKPAELDLNLDLNLPEAPKNDDRLKTEDQKNAEPVAVEAPKVEEVLQPTPEVKIEETVAPVMEAIPEVKEEVKQPEAKIEEAVEPKVEVPEIKEQPSTTVLEQPVTATAPAELKEDMKIISELE